MANRPPSTVSWTTIFDSVRRIDVVQNVRLDNQSSTRSRELSGARKGAKRPKVRSVAQATNLTCSASKGITHLSEGACAMWSLLSSHQSKAYLTEFDIFVISGSLLARIIPEVPDALSIIHKRLTDC